MSLILRTAFLCLATTLVGCGPSADSRALDREKFSGTFVHATLDGSELREISLPGGSILRRIEFPVEQGGSDVGGAGGLSDCGAYLVTTLDMPPNDDGI